MQQLLLTSENIGKAVLCLFKLLSSCTTLTSTVHLFIWQISPPHLNRILYRNAELNFRACICSLVMMVCFLASKLDVQTHHFSSFFPLVLSAFLLFLRLLPFRTRPRQLDRVTHFGNDKVSGGKTAAGCKKN